MRVRSPVLSRRPLLAGLLAGLVVPFVRPALPKAATLEDAVTELRLCRLAQLRQHSEGDDAIARRLSWRTLQAVCRLREAAKQEGLSPAQYRRVVKLSMRLGRVDYLRERGLAPALRAA
jgi:hypothetical protein